MGGMPVYSRRLPISTADLKRWEGAGSRLNHVPELLLRIYDIRAEPSKFRLRQAAKVARYAASMAAGPAKTRALALAEELERRAA